MSQDKIIKDRILNLKHRLAEENPILVEVLDRFVELDQLGSQLGVLGPRDSYTTDISWWPLISILGTFSAGKSSFINEHLQLPIQKTGNQAVDDKFTVICYSSDAEVRVLPGLALDADPRFPFYQMSEDIEKVAVGEGARIDTYLQLKTCPSDQVKGKIFIDSPGFDADAQRRSTLRITDHIINLSDLVLVFFDARHPEPGAMQDTIEHLVSGTVKRNDANKILFALNQIDTTAAEDNLEAVVAAWQRAIAQGGLVSGNFYTLYNESAAVKIEDQALAARYKKKRDSDVKEIGKRIREVSVERAYRIIGALENIAQNIESEVVPTIDQAFRSWRRNVWLMDLLLLFPVAVVFLAYTFTHGYWQGVQFSVPIFAGASWGPTASWIVLGGFVALLLALHFILRGWLATRAARKLPDEGRLGNLRRAFLKNTAFWRSLFSSSIVGWNKKTKSRLSSLRDAADEFVQKLNDQFANPSGKV